MVSSNVKGDGSLHFVGHAISRSLEESFVFLLGCNGGLSMIAE